MRRSKLLRFFLAMLLTAVSTAQGNGQNLQHESSSCSSLPQISPVMRVVFIGNTVVSAEDLSRAANIPIGASLSVAMISEAIGRIESAYAQRGYIASVSFYEITDEPAPRTLTFHIREVTIAGIRIVGLQRTRETFVLRVIGVQPGDVYNLFTVQQSVAGLSQLGIFEDVSVAVEHTDRSDQVDLVYEFVEAKTRRIDLGASYSPEGNVTAYIQYSDVNMSGSAQTLSGSIYVGSIKGKIGGNVTYYNPFFRKDDTSLLARAFSDISFRFSTKLVNFADVGRYVERRVGMQASLRRSNRQGIQNSYSIRYHHTNIENLPIDFMVAGQSSPDASVLVLGSEYSVDRVTVFGPLPGLGHYASTLAEILLVDFANDQADIAVKLGMDCRWYIPLSQPPSEQQEADKFNPISTLAIRLKVGTSVEGLPFSEQYFIGGVSDLRGYRESRFWGRHFVVSNTEYRHLISRSMVLVGFVDIGDAWGSQYQFTSDADTDYRQHKRFSPRAGVGLGFWWLTSLGVMRFEFAHGDANRVHFAVGQSF